MTTSVERFQFVVKIVAILGCGTIAGVFFAFSSFVMPALARLSPASGMAAMQSINITVINPLFMGVFLGTGLICLYLLVTALPRWHAPGMPFMLAGCLLYLVGTILVTMVFNVPLNDALAAAHPNSPEGAGLWARYLTAWTAWNHVRTLTSLAAAAAFVLALCQRATTPP